MVPNSNHLEIKDILRYLNLMHLVVEAVDMAVEAVMELMDMVTKNFYLEVVEVEDMELMAEMEL